MGNPQSTVESKSLRNHVKRSTNKEPGRNALILGPTGATGKFILSYLISSDEWDKVTIIHRREVNLDEISTKCNIVLTEQQQSKVTQHVVEMGKWCENDDAINKNVELFKGHDIVFCALGTKRSVAGTAENYRKIDYDMVRESAILAKKAGIKQFSLVSSKGANANLWANDWKITHGLLYLKTKGDAEQAVIKEKFTKISIFRPGTLARDGIVGFLKGLDVRDLATVIVYDAESELSDESKDEEPVFYEAEHIDNALEVSRINFNQVCVALEKTEDAPEEEKKEEKKEEVDVEKEVQSESNKQEDEVVESEDKGDGDKVDDKKQDKTEDGGNANDPDVEPKTDEVVVADDYVKVKKDETEKEKNDGNE